MGALLLGIIVVVALLLGYLLRDTERDEQLCVRRCTERSLHCSASLGAPGGQRPPDDVCARRLAECLSRCRAAR